LTVSDQNGTGVLDSPLVVALFLLTGYYALVALVHGARSVKRNPAVMGAALFAALSTAVTVWPLGGVWDGSPGTATETFVGLGT